VEILYPDLGEACQIACRAGGASARSDCFEPYSTRIEAPYSLWLAIARGEASGPEALYGKKFRVLGDFSLMARWDDFFGLPAAAPGPGAPAQKPCLAVLLGPWLALWAGSLADPALGARLGILAAALVPLAWLAFKPTVYERLTVLAVASLSLAALAGAAPRLTVPLGLALAGLTWLASCLARVPLAARYSAGDYGGEKAFKNPLFLRTNRVVTALWGAAFLLMALGNYGLMGAMGWPGLALFNGAAFGALGALSSWLARWHPAKWARG
jgi:hypothetical protein